MKLKFLGSLLLIAVLVALPALAYHKGSTIVVVQCGTFTGAAGLGFNDGCSGAPSYFNARLTYSNPNLLSVDSTTATFTGSISGDVLTVSGISGTIFPGGAILTGGQYANTIIAKQLGGAAGSNGTYRLSREQTASGSMSATKGGIFQAGQTVSANIHNSANPGGSIISWNVPGPDFNVGARPGTLNNGVVANAYCTGPYMAIDNPPLPCAVDTNGNLEPLIDASKYDWKKDLNAGYANFGCAATSTGQSQSPRCKVNSGTVRLAGLEFSPAQSTDGGLTYHLTCAMVEVQEVSAGESGTIYLTDSHLIWSGGTQCSSFSLGVYIDVAAIGTQPGGWQINVWYNYFDWDSPDAYNVVGNPQFFGVGQMITAGDGNPAQGTTYLMGTSYKWNYFGNIFGKAILNDSANCGGMEFSYNVVSNEGQYGGGEHGDLPFNVPKVVGGVQYAHCPNYVQGGGLPTSWAGSTFGSFQLPGTSTPATLSEINNAIWVNANHGAGAMEVALGATGGGPSSPDLVDISAGTQSFNTIIVNLATDPGGNFVSAQMNTNPLTGLVITGGTGYNSSTTGAAVNDILDIDIPSCRTGATPYSRPPTVRVTSTSGSPTITSAVINPGDNGNCGYSTYSNGTYGLICRFCLNESVSFATGWTVTTTAGNIFPSTTNASIGLGNSGGNGSGLNGTFINFESLTLKDNIVGNPGPASLFGTLAGGNGDRLSCSGGPIGSTLPVNSSAPYYTYSAGTHNAVVSGNVDQSGASLDSTFVGAFSTSNGC